MQQRQRKRCSLSRASGGQSQNVVGRLEYQGDNGALDGRGVAIAQFATGLD